MERTIDTFHLLLYHLSAMYQILLNVDLVLGLLLSIAILLQHRASGLSATFGGTGTTYVQRRGAEKVLFTFTVWVAVLFFIVAAVLPLFPAY